MSTSSTTSASQYQDSLSSSVGVTASYGSTRCSANADYKSANSGTNTNKAFSFVSGSILEVAICQLDTDLNKLKLTSSFLDIIQKIKSTTGEQQRIQLATLYSGYGT